jgi:hypothetical protein
MVIAPLLKCMCLIYPIVTVGVQLLATSPLELSGFNKKVMFSAAWFTAWLLIGICCMKPSNIKGAANTAICAILAQFKGSC